MWKALVNAHNEDLVESNAVALSNGTHKSDFFSVGRNHTSFRPRSCSVRSSRRKAPGASGFQVDETHAIVHDMGDRSAVGAPTECRTNWPRIVRKLSRRAAVRRNGPQLHNPVVVFHHEGDKRPVWRTVKPVSGPLNSRKFALGSKGEAPLNRAAGWKRTACF